MRKYMIGIVVGVLLASVVVVLAGSLDSPAAPGATSSYSLEDIYDRLDAGTAGSQSTFTEPGSGPGSTMHTLNDIMGKAPAVDDTNGAAVADVANGKTFWGLTSGQWGLQTGTATLGNTYNAGVPKTGQTTKYADGDDGDLQKGVAWPSPRFTDNGDGTVTDNLTGLIWLKDADCLGQTNWATALTNIGHSSDAVGTSLNSGKDFSCDSYTADTYDDWRLPNLRELHSLIHYGVYNPAVPNTAGTGKWSNNDPFTGVQLDYYWSSTTIAGNAWFVCLQFGPVSYGSKTNADYVWPVRGGP